MKIKRFFAKNMRQAMIMVKEDQGPDAVLLSSQKTKEGVEVVIAIDYDESVLENALQMERDTVHRENDDDAIQQISWTQDPSIVNMREEVKALRGLLENQVAHLAWGDMSRRDPNRAELLRRLNNMGIQSDLCEEMVDEVSQIKDVERAWRRIQGCLSGRIQITNDDILDQGGIVALVGPTGIGKTTTIAKLAAHYMLRHGPRSVALISADNYRIGAHEQLMTYGRILGIPVQVATDQQALSNMLQEMADKRLVLIDTAGMSQRDLRLSEQFDTLQVKGATIRTYLTLSATTQTAVLEETVRAFSTMPIDGCIITKLDESMMLGGVLSVVIRHKIPVAYVSDGQRVPEDIHPARADKLVTNAVTLMKEMKENTWNYGIAEQFGEMVANTYA